MRVLHELCATNCCVIQPPGSISGKAIMCPRQCLVGMSSSGNVVSYVHEPLGAMSGEAMVPATHVIIRDCCVLRASATRGKPAFCAPCISSLEIVMCSTAAAGHLPNQESWFASGQEWNPVCCPRICSVQWYPWFRPFLILTLLLFCSFVL